MNKELENQAAIALQKMIESATVVKDFALEQAPDVIHQLLTWKFVENLTWGILSIVSLIVLFALWGLYIIFYDFLYRKDLEPLILPLIALSISQIIISIFGIVAILNTIQIKIAPKIYLLEYAADLVK